MSKTTVSGNKNYETDIIGFLVTVVVGLVALFFRTDLSFLTESLVRIILALTALVATILYLYRVRNLDHSARTPFADTLILLSGVYVAFFLVTPLVIPNVQVPFFGALLLLITGIISKLILLDRFISLIFYTLIDTIESFFNWIFLSPFNTIRGLLWLGAILTTILSTQIDTSFPLIPLSYTLAGLPLLLSSFYYRDNQSNFILRFAAVGIAVITTVGLFSSSNSLIQLSLGFLTISLLVWSISIGLIINLTKSVISWITSIWPFLNQIISQIWSYIQSHPITTIRIFSFFSSLVLLFVGLISPSPFIFVGAGILFAIAILPSIIPVVKNWVISIYITIKEHPVGSFQIMSLLGALFAWIFLPQQNNFNIIAAVILVILAILPTAVSILKLIWKDVLHLLVNFKNWIFEHPVGTVQAILLVSALPAFLFLPPTPLIIGVSFRSSIALGLIFLGLSPSIYSVLETIIPAIGRLFNALFTWISSILNNPNTYFLSGSVGGFVVFFRLDPVLSFLRVAVLGFTTLSLSMLGNSFLMRFYDSLIYGLFSIASPVVRFIRYILPRFSIGALISFLAWVMLFLAITLRLFFRNLSSPGLIRLILFILAIITWNVAYPLRRERFWNFINRLTGGIISRLVNFSWWVIRNVWLILLWVVALSFFLIGIGFIFPGLFGFVTNLFGELDYLVSFIIGGFMFSMGIFTIRQAIIKRSDYQINVDGGKSS